MSGEAKAGAPPPRRPIGDTLRLLTLARACPHRIPGRNGCEWGACRLADGARVAPADCFACIDSNEGHPLCSSAPTSSRAGPTTTR